MALTSKINLFDNLSQYNYDNIYYDLHNDCECEKILFKDKELLFMFKNINTGLSLILKFTGVKISMINFFNSKDVENLTLDNLYRGRFEDNGTLKDLFENDEAYFYLEFYDGQKMEFWAKEFYLEQSEN